MSTETTGKAVKITVGISTDPRVAHIGRYFASMTDNRTNNQLTTRVHNAAGIAEFIGEGKAQATPVGIGAIVVEETGELDI